MFPVADFVHRRRTPYVNWALIAANIAVFVYTLTLDARPTERLGVFAVSETELFYFDWGALPACIAEYLGIDSGADPADLDTFCPEGEQPLLSVFSAMFLHGGLGHIVSNMIFLWVFGDNVEDRLGHLLYLFFYLLAGIAAMAVQTAFAVDSLIPTVGASGAIAGVMGGYLLLFPRATVQVVILPLFFIPFFVPALFLIGVWFAMQVFFGIQEIGDTAGAGIAWWAHIGGFVAGVVLILISGAPFRRRSRQS